MMRDTDRTSYAAKAHDAIDALQRYNGDAESYARAHIYVAAVAADVAKLRAYARELEEIVEYAQRDNYMIDDVADLRAEHGVADIMRGDDTPQPGAPGAGDGPGTANRVSARSRG